MFNKSCNLCRSSELKQLFSLESPALCSDLSIRNYSLNKLICSKCQLVFNAKTMHEINADHYKLDYQLTEISLIEEPMLFCNGVKKPRSEAIFELFLEKIKTHSSWELRNLSLIELGSGDGRLLERFKKVFSEVLGIEVNEQSRMSCLKRGLNVLPEIDSDFTKKFDLMVSFTVLEHLESPSEYFKLAKKLLKKNGLLITVVPSSFTKNAYDLFFVDHEFHFNKTHLVTYGHQFDLESIEVYEGQGWASGVNISVHRNSKATSEEIAKNELNPLDVIESWKKVLTSIDEFIGFDQPIMIFGAGQLFSFIKAYTNLYKNDRKVFLYDDNSSRYSKEQVFPIEEQHFKPNTKALLTFKPNNSLIDSLKKFGVEYLTIPGLQHDT